uniref:Uncharacterized protein n=1 Tax=Gasterosteus aculeatus aculeatus TaxID=481459 RepID=A0AAQ4R0H3_GASAC
MAKIRVSYEYSEAEDKSIRLGLFLIFCGVLSLFILGFCWLSPTLQSLQSKPANCTLHARRTAARTHNQDTQTGHTNRTHKQDTQAGHTSRTHKQDVDENRCILSRWCRCCVRRRCLSACSRAAPTVRGRLSIRVCRSSSTTQSPTRWLCCTSTSSSWSSTR